MEFQLEVYENGCAHARLEELRAFWVGEWSKFMAGVAGKSLDASEFASQSYFYVIRHHGQIIGVMSSTWQNTDQVAADDPYYASWPEAIQFLRDRGVVNYHKMGMIIARRDMIPRGFHMAPTIIGCGLKFVRELPACEAVVSFPRSDIRIFRSCLEWGCEAGETGLVMHGVPVSFIWLPMGNVREHHPVPRITSMVDDLWHNRVEIHAGALRASG